MSNHNHAAYYGALACRWRPIRRRDGQKIGVRCLNCKQSVYNTEIQRGLVSLKTMAYAACRGL